MEAYQVLEEEFGRWAGVQNVVACSSGTAALHLGLEALRLPPGSEVIIPDFCMVAAPRAAVLAGLTPVFVDCDDRLLIDPALVERAITPRTRAIMPVAVYGRACDMTAIMDIATRHDLAVVEDLAEAHGVPPHPDSDAAAFSFFRNKIITSGEEGGAVAFRCPQAAALARQLRCMGFTESHDYTHIPRGMNYRLANSLAAKVIESIAAASDNIFRRRQIERLYDRRCPPSWRMPPRDVVWTYDLRIPGLTPERQAKLARRLQHTGIAARHGFKPMHAQEEFRDCRRIGGEAADLASREVLYLPVQPGVTTDREAALAFDLLGLE